MTTQTWNRPTLHVDSATSFPSVVHGTGETDTATSGYPAVAPPDDPGSLYAAEKAAFESLRPSLEPQYVGKYVAVHGGEVVDSDESRVHLLRRFFRTRGDTHVYVGYVGRLPVAHQLTPFTF